MHGAIERDKAFQKKFAARRWKKIGALAENIFGEYTPIALSTASWMFPAEPSNRTEVKTCAQ
jgi:hypothetical protein